ncbi:MAG: hypothetical protein ABIQ88_18295 [Chitinophagaceae bacterium]
MPTTAGPQIRTIADIFKTALKCSSEEAKRMEMETCKSPASIAKLATACGISKMGVGFGGVLIVGGATMPEGIALTAVGLMGVRRFCGAMINQSGNAIEGLGNAGQ